RGAGNTPSSIYTTRRRGIMTGRRSAGHQRQERAQRPARERLKDQVAAFLAERDEDPDLRDATKKQMAVNLPSFMEWATAQGVGSAADCTDTVMTRYKAHLATRPSLKDAKKTLSAQSQSTYLRNV